MRTVRLLGATLVTAVSALAAAGQEPRKDQPPAADAEPATLRVYVMPTARLTVDNTPIKQTGADRRFVTPPLPRGKTFSYTLKATWQEGGREIVRMAVARVQAGKEAEVDLREGSRDGSSSQIIFVPTPAPVVDKMLEIAKVTKDDIVYDLGCGDGRIVIAAAKKYGARGVGIDIDPVRVKKARANAQREGVEKLVEIRQGDALKTPDVSKATVVALYMLPEFMEKLGPILKKELKPGTRIVAHDYPFPNWQADLRLTVPAVDRLIQHTLYLWKVGEPGQQ
jgi:uncharacterized protein (TIGR03000 family)